VADHRIVYSHPTSEGRHRFELFSLPIRNMRLTKNLLSRVMVMALIFALQLVAAAPNGLNTVPASRELECKPHMKMLTIRLTLLFSNQ